MVSVETAFILVGVFSFLIPCEHQANVKVYQHQIERNGMYRVKITELVHMSRLSDGFANQKT